MAEEYTYGATPLNADVDVEDQNRMSNYTDTVKHLSIPYYSTEQVIEPLGFFATGYETYMQETIIGDSLRYGMFIKDKYARPYNTDYVSGDRPVI